MWIIRGTSGRLYAVEKRPKFENEIWLVDSFGMKRLKSDLFPEIVWKSEPVWKRFLRTEWIEENIFICG